MIDAHVHLWRIGRADCVWPGPDLPAIHRDFTIDEFRTASAGAGVTGAVLVQSQESERDTRWLLSIAGDGMGVVGWTDLHAPDVAERIDRLMTEGPLVGIRPMVQDRADDWYNDPPIDAGLRSMAARGLVLDALVRPRHLPALARLAARHPGLSIVIDHGAKPVIDGERASWVKAMTTLATFPNLGCKLSGLLTEVAGGRPDTDILPYMDELMTIFGPDRLIWGSDWPVVTMRAGYRAWLDMARGAVPPGDVGAVFGGNAARLYRMAERAA